MNKVPGAGGPPGAPKPGMLTVELFPGTTELEMLLRPRLRRPLGDAPRVDESSEEAIKA